MRSRHTAIAVSILAPALALAACGGGSGGSGSSTAAPTSASSASSSAAVPAYVTDNCGVPGGDPTSSDAAPEGIAIDGVIIGDTATPTITVGPESAPATALVTKDLAEGSGSAVKPGETVTVDYCLVGQQSRVLIDSSWARGKPLTIGLDQVIQGWANGVPGMKPGGRRVLLIPGDQGYGPNPSPDSPILPNETLIFVVDLISVP